MNKINNDDVLVLFSGGQDSTTCLYWAKRKFRNVYALSFIYGQKHQKEVEVAKKIGGNALLVRTGALYHDLGKMVNPMYYTENQTGVNPLNELPYEEAAQVIISHVQEGVKIAEKHNLPYQIIEFIQLKLKCLQLHLMRMILK